MRRYAVRRVRRWARARRAWWALCAVAVVVAVHWAPALPAPGQAAAGQAEGYDRALYPVWLDPDGNGCDARQDALAVAPGATVVRHGCKVAGTWPLGYIDGTTTNPGRLDVDHVVPLGFAHRAGAAGWPADRRAAFANDPTNLWPVDAAQNRVKGDRGPADWRPPARTAWCEYATRWEAVVAAYGLVISTSDRSALDQMKETCP